jgi:hypothetical protein
MAFLNLSSAVSGAGFGAARGPIVDARGNCPDVKGAQESMSRRAGQPVQCLGSLISHLGKVLV